mmetsp:Transcript_15655/g.28011  ORF Transcript_15655/g.28011 Transcript_15655/m.28011 type:complete len:1038 (+) Transcript_15655:93-3206(+)
MCRFEAVSSHTIWILIPSPRLNASPSRYSVKTRYLPPLLRNDSSSASSMWTSALPIRHSTLPTASQQRLLPRWRSPAARPHTPPLPKLDPTASMPSPRPWARLIWRPLSLSLSFSLPPSPSISLLSTLSPPRPTSRRLTTLPLNQPTNQPPTNLQTLVGGDENSLEVLDQGVAGVGQRALVIKGLLSEFVHDGQELGILGSGAERGLKRGWDSSLAPQTLNGSSQVLGLLDGSRSAKLECVGELGVIRDSARGMVAGEDGLLEGRVSGVVADDVRQEYGGGNADGDVAGDGDLVSQGLGHPEESVGIGHAGLGGGVEDLLGVGGGEGVEDLSKSLAREVLGAVGGGDGDEGLDGVGNGFEGAGGDGGLGEGGDEGRVHDGGGGEKGRVGDGVALAGGLVDKGGERRDFGSRTDGGGDGDQAGLRAQSRHVVHALAHVHEADGEAVETGLRVLVAQPNQLGGVDGGAAANRDNGVGVEGDGGLQPSLDSSESGCGANSVEDSGLGTGLGQGSGNSSDVGVLIGNDQHLLPGELGEGAGGAAGLQENGGGDVEATSPVAALSDALHVDEVEGSDVVGDDVSAPGPASKSHGRSEDLVVDASDGALGRGGVDEDAAGLGHGLEGLDVLTIVGVGVDDGGVTSAAEHDEFVGGGQGGVEVGGPVHGEDRGELLLGQGLLLADHTDLANQHLGSSRNSDAEHLGELGYGLTDDVGVQLAVLLNALADLDLLLLVQEVGAAANELRADLVVHRVHGDNGLLGRADDTVVEGLGDQDGVDGQFDVGGLVNQRRGVAGADTQGRVAGRVSGADHSRTTGSQNQADFRGLHERLGNNHGRACNPGNDSLGCSGCHGSVVDDFGRLNRALGGAGMRAQDEAVAGFKGEESLEDSGGSGIGGGDNAGNHTNGLSHLRHSAVLVVFDDTTGFGGLVLVVDELRSEVVLDDLVLNHAHARFRHSHLGKRETSSISGFGSTTEHMVYLFLRKFPVYMLSMLRFFQGFVKNRKFFVFDRSPNLALFVALLCRSGGGLGDDGPFTNVLLLLDT